MDTEQQASAVSVDTRRERLARRYVPLVRWSRFRNPWVYVLTVAPSLALAIFAAGISLAAAGERLFPGWTSAHRLPSSVAGWIFEIVSMVVFGPVVETAMMIGTLALAARWSVRPRRLIVALALGWAVPHMLMGGPTSVLTFFAFLFFYDVLLRCLKEGYTKAGYITAVAHGIYNTTLLLIVAAASLMGW